MNNRFVSRMKLTAVLWIAASVAVLASTEEQINKTLAVPAGGKLVVDVDFGEIDVKTHDAAEVNIDVWRKITRPSKAAEETFLRDSPVVITQDGGTVTIRSRLQPKPRFNWSLRNRNEGKYTLRVPAQFNASVNTAGGGISVAGLTGEVTANTSGGGLKFSRIHGPLTGNTSGGGIDVADCDGKIKINTSGGGIGVSGGGGSLSGVTSGGGVSVKNFAGPAGVATSGGGITIANVGGKVDGATSGGHINLTLPAPLPGPVRMSTSGGGVTVRAPETAAFLLDASTAGGGVSCDLPITLEGKKKNDSMRGTVNDGATLVHLRSSGGGIHVKKL